MTQHILNISRSERESQVQDGKLVNRLINRTTLRIGDHNSSDMEEETLQLKFVLCESVNSPESDRDEEEEEMGTLEGFLYLDVEEGS